MRHRDRISLGVSGVALCASVLILGGALRWAQAVVAGLIALALALQLFSRRRLDRVSPILVLLGAAAGLTAFQLVPLPVAVLDALTPTGEALRNEGAKLAGTAPWQCISMDPAGTLRALVFFLTLIGVANLSLRFAASERGRFYVLAGVVLVCGLAAAVTGIHVLLGLTDLYGVYAPLHANPPILGPLLNANHLGGLGAMGAILAIGLTFYERQPSQLKALWLVIGLGCTLVVLGSLSRGATLGLVFGLVVTLATVIGGRLAARDATSRQRRRSLGRDIPIIFVVATGLGLAVYTSAGNVADQIERTTITEVDRPLSKFEAWKSSVHLVAESPWVGQGRGAVEPTLTRVHPASAYATFSHLENEYVSAIVEWGVPGALIVALALGLCIITAMRRWRDGPLAAAAIGAMAAIMFQSSVDFGVEILGLAVPATIVASTLLLVPFRDSGKHTRMRVLRIGLIAAIAIGGLVVLRPEARSIQEDHDELSALEEPLFDDIRAEIERHPLDYLGFAQASDVLVRSGDQRAVAFLNHAMELHPWHPGLHRLAARMLVAQHRSQAIIEYSLAMHGTMMPKELLTEIVTILPNAAEAGAAIPADWEPVDPVLQTLHEMNRDDVAVKWLRAVIQQPQVDTTLIDMMFQMALDQKDLDDALFAAEQRIANVHTYSSRLMLAKVHFLRHELEPILSDLADVASWRGRSDEQGDAWLILCDVYAEQQKYDTALECYHHLDGAGILTPRQHVDVAMHLKSLEDRRLTEVKLQELATPHHEQIPDTMPQIYGTEPATGSGASGIVNPLNKSPLAPKSK